MVSMKAIIKKIIGNKNLGRIDYFLKPEYKKVWGGAFNGQTFRRKIFQQLFKVNDFELIVETGSYRGNTTLFMAEQTVPIVTVEYDARIFGYVSTRFLLNSQIKTFNNDSRPFLKSIALDSTVAKEDVFFYLDAHWDDDLPLAEELQIISSYWNNWVVMIDDFQVPNGTYDYDDYGDGKALTLEYVEKALPKKDYSAYFPAVDASEETGFKRGCVVLCNSQETVKNLDQCDTLVRWQS